MSIEKEFDQIKSTLHELYGWDLDKVDPNFNAESLVDYTIKAVKYVLVNTPHAEHFNSNVMAEMAHHAQRWGDESQTPPHHFQMVLSMICGKLARAIFDKDVKKFSHHLITLAAVSGSAHKYLSGETETARWFDPQNESV